MIGFWDPMGLADLPLWNQDEEAVIGARRRSRTAQALTARLGTLAHRRCASRLEGCRAQPSPDWQAGCATLRSSTGVSRWRASWATASTLTASSSRSRARRVSVRPSPLLQPSRASPCPPPMAATVSSSCKQQLQAAPPCGQRSLRCWPVRRLRCWPGSDAADTAPRAELQRLDRLLRRPPRHHMAVPDGLSAPEVWDAIPFLAKLQIIGAIGMLEHISEDKNFLAADGHFHTELEPEPEP